MGWTPLMIAASVKDSDRVVDLLLARDADVNETSTSMFPYHVLIGPLTHYRISPIPHYPFTTY